MLTLALRLCHLCIDIRVPIGIDWGSIVYKVEAIVAAHESATLEQLVGSAANYSNPEHRMARLIKSNAKAVGLPDLVAIPSVGASDCKFWRERGVPAFVFGTTPRNIAAPNERLQMNERDNEIDELARSLLGNIVQGVLAGGKIVDPKATAELAVLCATALVDKLADSRG